MIATLGLWIITLHLEYCIQFRYPILRKTMRYLIKINRMIRGQENMTFKKKRWKQNFFSLRKRLKISLITVYPPNGSLFAKQTQTVLTSAKWKDNRNLAAMPNIPINIYLPFNFFPLREAKCYGCHPWTYMKFYWTQSRCIYLSIELPG